jgi:hypothetical protein
MLVSWRLAFAPFDCAILLQAQLPGLAHCPHAAAGPWASRRLAVRLPATAPQDWEVLQGLGPRPVLSNLVKQRLKEMVIGTVDDRDVHCRTGQFFDSFQATKAAAYHHDARPLSVLKQNVFIKG